MNYKHAEAFCLMQYQDQETGETELVWNSRDGVSPFMIVSKRGNSAHHICWHEDWCKPNFKPAPGMRIFTSSTPENLERYFQENRDRLIEAFGSEAEARRLLTKEVTEEHPILITVK